MSFRNGAAYAKALAATNKGSIAVVTGGGRGIGLSIAKKIASFPFIDTVLAVSRSIQDTDVKAISPKIQALQADVTTDQGRQQIISEVTKLCGDANTRQKQVRFLVHSAGTIDPIKNILDVQPNELRQAMLVNVESPFFLTTALYPFMTTPTTTAEEEGVAGRVLHVSSGAAHGAPPSGWGCYGISKAAFFQSYRVLEREFRETLGGKVLVGSFKPGVVDTSMQGTIRDSSTANMPAVDNFKKMKEKATAAEATTAIDNSKARPPPAGALDSPDNVAFFAEYLLVGTTDEEFANKDDSNEYDIRNKELFSKWIADE